MPVDGENSVAQSKFEANRHFKSSFGLSGSMDREDSQDPQPNDDECQGQRKDCSSDLSWLESAVIDLCNLDYGTSGSSLSRSTSSGDPRWIRAVEIACACAEEPSVLDSRLVLLFKPLEAVIAPLIKGELPSNDLVTQCASFLYTVSNSVSVHRVLRSSVLPSDPLLITPICQRIMKSAAHSDSWQLRYILLTWLAMLSLAPFESIDWTELWQVATTFSLSLGPESKPAHILLGRLMAKSVASEGLARVTAAVASMPTLPALEALHQALKHLSDSATMKREAAESIPDGLMELISSLINPEKDRAATDVTTSSFQSPRLCILRCSCLSFIPKAFGLECTSEPVVQRVVEPLINAVLVHFSSGNSVVRWRATKSLCRLCRSFKCREMVSEVTSHCLRSLTITAAGRDGQGSQDSLASQPQHSSLQLYALNSVQLFVAQAVYRGLLEMSDELYRVAVAGFQTARSLGGVDTGSLFSLATQLVDSSCFIVWSASKHCTPDQMLKGVFPKFSEHLIWCSLFERTVGSRRSAAATLQEILGRIGTIKYPEGLSILNLIDYWAVSSPAASFVTIPHKLLQLESLKFLRKPFVESLLLYRISHTSDSFRTLSAQGLSKLSCTDPELVSVVVKHCIEEAMSTSKTISSKCGAIQTLIELLRDFKGAWNPKDQSQLRNLLPSLHAASAFGPRPLFHILCLSLLRELASKARSSSDHFGFRPDGATHKKYVEVGLSFLKASHFGVQLAAALAVRSILLSSETLMTQALSRQTYSELLRNTVSQLTVQMDASLRPSNALVRGSVFAIGLISDLTDDDDQEAETILETLINFLRRYFQHPRPDSEAGLLATFGLAQTLICSRRESPTLVSHTHSIYQLLCSASSDFTMDERGDVGAAIRCCSAVFLERLMSDRCQISSAVESHQGLHLLGDCLIARRCDQSSYARSTLARKLHDTQLSADFLDKAYQAVICATVMQRTNDWPGLAQYLTFERRELSDAADQASSETVVGSRESSHTSVAVSSLSGDVNMVSVECLIDRVLSKSNGSEISYAIVQSLASLGTSRASPELHSVFIGLIKEKYADRISELVRLASEKGASIVSACMTGGSKIDRIQLSLIAHNLTEGLSVILDESMLGSVKGECIHSLLGFSELLMLFCKTEKLIKDLSASVAVGLIVNASRLLLSILPHSLRDRGLIDSAPLLTMIVDSGLASDIPKLRAQVAEELVLRLQHTISPADQAIVMRVLQCLNDTVWICDEQSDTTTVANASLLGSLLGLPPCKSVCSYKTKTVPALSQKGAARGGYQDFVIENYIRRF